MEVEPIGPKTCSNYHESDIYKIECGNDGYLFLVDTVNEESQRVDVTIEFDAISGFRYLDEGDLMYYWDNQNFRFYNLFKIINGGWLDGEDMQKGILTLSRGSVLHEYFIVTTNGCVNILSYEPPKITVSGT
ncbi:hypothetical protein [Pseudoalteromonas sp. S554]|jgi:hypothetical protein|uniref:hypothetical protein n=1 Tax=Pseudoalteromonas sp. S554 TaxID=2066516 RepID=UPI00110D01C4|nr:hypothetical protein [Pseudoalteromonas sp. S554]TMS79551.1 hypothetical protein CWB65_19615 [Pseudoalteromonas sp. S554]